MSINVVIVEDDPVFQARFADTIQSSDLCKLVGIAHTGAGGMVLIDKKIADVYLIDLGLPDFSGIELIRHIAAHHPQADVMVVSVFGDSGHILQSLEAGATGYVLKDEVPAQFISSIVALRNGGAPISPNIAKSILERFIPRHIGTAEPTPPRYLPNQPEEAHRPPDSLLTPRETQILSDLSLGMPISRIADKRAISPHSVSQHLRNIYRKLRVRSRSEAVYTARSQGLLGN
jgi:DNA-binding NarL/FixJ family response regulator